MSGTVLGPPRSGVPGSLGYDKDFHVLGMATDFGTLLQNGQEGWVIVKNATGGALANGAVVRINGAATVAGVDVATVELSNAGDESKDDVDGILTTAIADGALGLMTFFGNVNSQNTAAFAVGNTLYLSASIPGAYTNVRPATAVEIGKVLTAHASNGRIAVALKPSTRPPSGAAFMEDNATVTVIASVNTWTKIAGTTVAGPLYRFTMPANNRLQYTGAQTRAFSVAVGLSIRAESGTNKTFEVAVFKNGTLIQAGKQAVKISTDDVALPVISLVSLATNDYIEVFARNITDALDCIIKNMQVVVSG